jgi:hypothetical protein
MSELRPDIHRKRLVRGRQLGCFPSLGRVRYPPNTLHKNTIRCYNVLTYKLRSTKERYMPAQVYQVDCGCGTTGHPPVYIRHRDGGEPFWACWTCWRNVYEKQGGYIKLQ